MYTREFVTELIVAMAGIKPVEVRRPISEDRHRKLISAGVASHRRVMCADGIERRACMATVFRRGVNNPEAPCPYVNERGKQYRTAWREGQAWARKEGNPLTSGKGAETSRSAPPTSRDGGPE